MSSRYLSRRAEVKEAGPETRRAGDDNRRKRMEKRLFEAGRDTLRGEYTKGVDFDVKKYF